MPKTNPEGQFLSDGVDVRTGNSVEALKRAFVDNLFFVQGKFFPVATLNDYYMALAYTVRDRLLARWIETSMQYLTSRARTVCYLSAEFLLGPHLGNNLLNLGICDEVEEAMDSLGLSLRELLEARDALRSRRGELCVRGARRVRGRLGFGLRGARRLR